jgi:hypothetical protein
MKKTILCLAITSLALASTSGVDCEPCPGPSPFIGNDDCPNVEPDATEQFATSDSTDVVPLCWDVYLPDQDDFDPPWPVVVIIHGGGFEQNHRRVGNLICIAHDLALSGFAAVSISYRLDKLTFNDEPCGQGEAAFAPQYAPFDQISDVKKAIIAASRGKIMGDTPSVLDGKVTGKVAAIGGSAGGAHAAWCAATGTNNNDTLDAAVFLSGNYQFDEPNSLLNEPLTGFCRKVKDYCKVMEPFCDSRLSQDARQKLHDGSALHQIALVNDVPNICPFYAFDTFEDSMPEGQLDALVDKLDEIAPGDPNYLHLRFHNTEPGNVHSFSYWFDLTDPADDNSAVNELAKEFLHDHLDAP